MRSSKLFKNYLKKSRVSDKQKAKLLSIEALVNPGCGPQF
jgi:hypothetical protein